MEYDSSLPHKRTKAFIPKNDNFATENWGECTFKTQLHDKPATLKCYNAIFRKTNNICYSLCFLLIWISLVMAQW